MVNFSYILVVGNMVDGHTFYGPYETFDEAQELAEREIGLAQEWWIAKLWNDITDPLNGEI